MTNITTIGLDLAKSVFQVHCADKDGRPVLRKKLRRAQVLEFFAKLPPCLVGMEACASAHHWARELQALGHEVRLIPLQFVKPFVKTNKVTVTVNLIPAQTARVPKVSATGHELAILRFGTSVSEERADVLSVRGLARSAIPCSAAENRVSAPHVLSQGGEPSLVAAGRLTDSPARRGHLLVSQHPSRRIRIRGRPSA